MFYPFKKFFLLLLVVLPCFFAEAADRLSFTAMISKVNRFSPNPLYEIGYYEKEGEICGTLDIEQMDFFLSKLFDFGKQAIDENNNELLLCIAMTLKYPTSVMGTEGIFEGNFFKYKERRKCERYEDFSTATRGHGKEKLDLLINYYEKKGGNKSLLLKNIDYGEYKN